MISPKIIITAMEVDLSGNAGFKVLLENLQINSQF